MIMHSTRGFGGLVLSAILMLGNGCLSAQCPPDAAYPYMFCKNGMLVERCASDPYHLFEDGQKLIPFRRYYPGCMSIELGGRLDIYMPKIVTGGTDDYVPVFLVANQAADIAGAFNAWNNLCPQSTGSFDCCVKIYFTEDIRQITDDNTAIDYQGIQGTTTVDTKTCRPSCNDEHRIYVNDSPEWVYRTSNPDIGNVPVRYWYTGQYPPSIAPGYQAYSLIQAIMFATGAWYGLPDIREPDLPCDRPNSIMAHELTEGPPTGLTPDDICQFQKLYCDHEVGLGVEADTTPALAFTVAPNPASTAVTLRLPSDVPFDPLTLRVVDAGGAMVRDLHLQEHGREIVVDLSGMSGGVYMVTLSDGRRTFGEKVILQR